MINALLYLQWHSFRNRARARLRRLRQPKYLLAALVGALYLSLILLGPHASAPSSGRPPDIQSPAVSPLLAEMLGALLLLVLTLGAWVFPGERAALVFGEAEIAFLFPAPVTRRTLIHFKLARSQVAILLTSFIFTLLFNRHRSGPFWTAAIGWWLVLSIVSLHRLGASFARTMLMDRGITNWQRRLAVLGLAAAAGAAVLVWAWQALPPMSQDLWTDLPALGRYYQQVLTAGPLLWLLYPFRLVVRPYLAPDAASFALAAGPALLLLALHYAWVVRADVAFEESSVEASRRLAEKLAAVRREGSGLGSGALTKARRPPFALRPVGPPYTALLWKNLIGASRLFSSRFILALPVLLIAMLLPAVDLARRGGLSAAVGFAAALFCGYTVFFGPQIVRQDFRADLALADLLKLYPLRGWQVVLGEVLAPVVVISAAQWLLILVSVTCLWHGPAGPTGGGRIAALGLAAALALPALNFVLLLIINAAALLLPAWVNPARGSARGLEVMGQQLLLALGQFVVLLLALALPAGVFATVFFLGTVLGSPAWALVLATLVAALGLAGEMILGLLLVGRLFERLDIGHEQTP